MSWCSWISVLPMKAANHGGCGPETARQSIYTTGCGWRIGNLDDIHTAFWWRGGQGVSKLSAIRDPALIKEGIKVW